MDKTEKKQQQAFALRNGFLHFKNSRMNWNKKHDFFESGIFAVQNLK